MEIWVLEVLHVQQTLMEMLVKLMVVVVVAVILGLGRLQQIL